MADDTVEAQIRITAVDETASVMQGVARRLEEVGSHFTRFLGIGALEEFARHAYTGFANVERGLERLQFATRATDQQMKGFRDDLVDLARRTGQSFESLTEDFNEFAVRSNQAFEPTREQFKTIGDIAVLTGASIGDISRAAAAAANNLKVPADQMQNLLKVWATELPGKIMEPFAVVAPRLMASMQAAGFTGEKAAQEIALAFGEVNKSLANPRQSFATLNDLLSKMVDISSPLGRLMLPQLQSIKEQGGSIIDVFDALFTQLDRMGLFSSNEANRSIIAKAMGVDFQTLRGIEVLRSQIGHIREELGHTTEKAAEFDRTAKKFAQDPKSAVDNLTASLEELEHKFAELMQAFGANEALRAVADIFKSTVTDIENIKAGIDHLKEMFPSFFNSSQSLSQRLGAGAIHDALQARGLTLDKLERGPGAGPPYRDEFEDRSLPRPHAGEPRLPRFQHGGTVPGPHGSEQVIIAHGGERVIPGAAGSGDTIVIQNTGPGNIQRQGESAGPEEVKAQTQQVKELINRLDRWMGGAGYGGGRQGAYTPGAGEAAKSAEAGLFAGAGGGGGGSGGGYGGGYAPGPGGTPLILGPGVSGRAGAGTYPGAEAPAPSAGTRVGLGMTPDIPSGGGVTSGQYAGVGGYNFMGSAAARAMGMNVTPGSRADMVTRKTIDGKSITANRYAIDDMVGFYNDLKTAGADLSQFSGVYEPRMKRGGGGWSQHAYGNAMDIETGFGSGPNNSPRLFAWAQAHPKEFAEIQARHHMRNLDTSSGAGMHDWGHFEWTPASRMAASPQSAYPTSSDPAPMGGGDLNEQAYERMFAGTKLAGHYGDVVREANANNVPPSLVAGIMAHETGRGTSAFVNQKNNPAGLMDPKTGMATGQVFGSIEQGIKASAGVIAKNFRRGGGTIAGMANIYAPVGAANDPRGLNKGWAAGVTMYQNALRRRGASTAPALAEFEPHVGGPTQHPADAPAITSQGGADTVMVPPTMPAHEHAAAAAAITAHAEHAARQTHAAQQHRPHHAVHHAALHHTQHHHGMHHALHQHRMMRHEMERPIRTRVEGPHVPRQLAPFRRRTARNVARRHHNDQLRNVRAEYAGDIGFA